MGHLSIHYETSIYTVLDICVSSMEHRPHIICDIYIFINGHLSIQYGTSTYAVWDIYLNCTLFLGDWLLGCYFLVIGD